MSDHDGLVLSGPDGANPLGFMCALGVLRTATTVWPDRGITMGWLRRGTGWRPVLRGNPTLDGDELVDGLYTALRFGLADGSGQDDAPAPKVAFPHFEVAKNTSKIEPAVFVRLAERYRDDPSPQGRTFLAFLAAFGSDAVVNDGFIADTALRTMSGSGHQHFLQTMLDLVSAIEPVHVREALLAPWRYQDPTKNLSMRWDPSDLKQYALQAGDPSTDPTRKESGSMLGANRLAVEALPLLTTMPVLQGVEPALATTGFETGTSQPHWVWPLWEDLISVDSVSSLLCHPLVSGARTGAKEHDGATLRRLGVVELFRSQRVNVGYFRNFTPSTAV